MSANQPMDMKPVPAGAGDEQAAREGSTDPNEPGAVPIIDVDEARIDPDPAYQDDQPVGSADADEDARRVGGSRE
jgi:hypothetical protein